MGDCESPMKAKLVDGDVVVNFKLVPVNKCKFEKRLGCCTGRTWMSG